MKSKIVILALICVLVSGFTVKAQDQAILIPKPLYWSPVEVDDSTDLFGKAWRFYRDGFTEWAADSLRKLVGLTGFEIKKNNYYIVVANFNNTETPIGMFHGDSDFHDTRLYGLESDSLFYIFITRDETSSSYVSTVAIRKESYFAENLLNFISLFPFISQMKSRIDSEYRTWIDIRRYDVPKKFQENCDISVIVKKDFTDEGFLARARFDNTSLERWSYGIATAVTSVNDVDFIIDNGRIVVKPKPKGDLATFGVVNFHFKPVDTKAKTLATSFHLLGGFRISRTIEPILGAGFGIPLGIIDLHLFAGYSVEFAQVPDDGFEVGQEVARRVDPFKLKIRGKPRYGIELKFP
ncbi:hypothetical protein GF337_17190 [candidate division KSB1 bacterium]|nr:hypothetical protein [candidate division KSB1 bacterium]